MSTVNRQLIAVHATVVRPPRRIVFRYKKQRWEIFESLRVSRIREALKVVLETIEEAIPGTLAKAVEIDDENWQSEKRRTRRYIAESPDLIYIDSPHLLNHVVRVENYYVHTNIAWRDVPSLLRMVCKAAGIEYGSLANIKFQ